MASSIPTTAASARCSNGPNTYIDSAAHRFGEVYALAWSPDGKYLASVGDGGWSSSGWRQQASRPGYFTSSYVPLGPARRQADTRLRTKKQ